MAAGNSVWDEVKEQRRKLKGRPFREKLSWFWEYYKIHTLVVLPRLRDRLRAVF